MPRRGQRRRPEESTGPNPLTVEQVIYQARENLSIAKIAWVDIESRESARRGIGLNSAITFGKSAIDVLQKMRRIRRNEFDAWFKPYQQLIDTDPLVQWFIDQRSRILKTGDLARVYCEVAVQDFPRLMEELFGEPPSGADTFFMTPEASGWVIALPDGSTKTQLVDLTPSEDLAEEYGVVMRLQGAPTTHLSQELIDQSPKAIVWTFLTFVEAIILAADQKFCSATVGDSADSNVNDL